MLEFTAHTEYFRNDKDQTLFEIIMPRLKNITFKVNLRREYR